LSGGREKFLNRADAHELHLVKEGGRSQIFPAELSLFETPPLSAAYTSEQFVDYRANTPNLNSGGSINFVIPGMVSQFVSLARSRLHMRLKVVSADGTRDDPTTLEQRFSRACNSS